MFTSLPDHLLTFYRTTQSKLFSRTRLAFHHHLEGHWHLQEKELYESKYIIIFTFVKRCMLNGLPSSC